MWLICNLSAQLVFVNCHTPAGKTVLQQATYSTTAVQSVHSKPHPSQSVGPV